MNIDFALFDGIQLKMTLDSSRNSSYPTARIQKGLILWCDGQDLSEEAVGFGVPILKRGLYTNFPGQAELSHNSRTSPNEFTARYTLNLEEKFTRSGSNIVNNRLVYRGKNILAGMIRGFPFLRKPLTGASNLLRSILSWQTTYEPAQSSTYITLRYIINANSGTVLVDLIDRDFSINNITEIIVMNEQGAHSFDQFQEAGGITKQGEEIGCWDEVAAKEAAFISSRHRVSFSLPCVRGAKLYMGRELISNRLAWSGFGYSFSPNHEHFSYEIKIKRLP